MVTPILEQLHVVELNNALEPLLQIWTLRPREGKGLVQGNVVSPSSVFFSFHQAASKWYYLNKVSGA